MVKRDDGFALFCQVIVGDGGGSSTHERERLCTCFIIFYNTYHNRCELGGRVFGSLVLVVGGLVGFVDDDEAEISDWCKEGGARTDDDLGLVVFEDVLPK